ncbi:hypothetical protein KAZ66_00875 [Candidatus Woesebacteria bacterium]|nr:hypothetical protein [Candidatus Woesebacteria bacterium]
MNRLFFIISVCVLLFITSRQLLPTDRRMFLAHDETQAARIQQFNLNIQQGKIPPRIAPDFSFGLGYPVFNYYAPFPYWVTQLFQLSGFGLINAMKLTYLLALFIGFSGMYVFLRRFFFFYPSILGAFIYTTSPYIAVDIFVRGNIGETWIFALLPWALYLLITNSKKRLIITAFVLSFLFTAHNILSLISLGIIIVFISLLQKKILNIISIASGLLLSSYFLIPAVFEISFVQARSIATKTQYTDHFLCISQIWTSVWGYAGSAPGCTTDGMSFMLGKIPILLSISGMLLFLYTSYIHKPNKILQFIQKSIDNIVNFINQIYPVIRTNIPLSSSEIQRISLFMLALTLVSIFMTTYQSLWIWKLFEPILSLFQFPWRFLMFSLFGISFFSAFLLSNVSKYAQTAGALGLMIIIALLHAKYFQGNMISQEEFTNKYLSQKYIKQDVAYKVPEYIPTHVNYDAWKKAEKQPSDIRTSDIAVKSKDNTQLEVQNTPFSKIFMAKASKPLVANIHYAPYWKITVDGVSFIPTKFDSFGRPLIDVKANDFSTIQINYEQTDTEIFANLMTIISSGILIAFTAKQFASSWSTIIKKT